MAQALQEIGAATQTKKKNERTQLTHCCIPEVLASASSIQILHIELRQILKHLYTQARIPKRTQHHI